MVNRSAALWAAVEAVGEQFRGAVMIGVSEFDLAQEIGGQGDIGQVLEPLGVGQRLAGHVPQLGRVCSSRSLA